MLSLLCGLLIAGVGVQLSMYSPTARQAHQRLGFVILGIFMTPAVAVPALPWAWRERMVGWFDEVGAMWLAGLGLSLLLLACVLLLLVAMLRFHRARLIL
jgi:hypothetical protein